MIGMGVWCMGVRMTLPMIVDVMMGPCISEDLSGIDCQHRPFRKICGCTDTLDMMMVAFLHGADFGLEPQYLRAVLAHLAVHGDIAREYLFDALFKGGNDQ